jgi:FMN phosphatase YigB (HAD superfamily)
MKQALALRRTARRMRCLVHAGQPALALLGERVDACCVSGEVDIRKPDVRIFQLAAERCGATLADGGWMVGDNREHDILGGRAAGLRTMWIGRRDAWPGGEPRADRTVPDVLAAISLLRDGPWRERDGRSKSRSR